MRFLFSITIVAGIWLLASPFALGYLGAARGNALIIGLLVSVVGLMGVAGTLRVRK